MLQQQRFILDSLLLLISASGAREVDVVKVHFSHGLLGGCESVTVVKVCSVTLVAVTLGVTG